MIPPEELCFEPHDSRPPGGQHAGTSSAIKATHLPTGLIAIVSTERSQLRNRQIAEDMILGGLTSPHFRG